MANISDIVWHGGWNHLFSLLSLGLRKHMTLKTRCKTT